jgi:flagellar biogenesis protein FliO
VKPRHTCALLAAVWLCHAGLEGQVPARSAPRSGTGGDALSPSGGGRILNLPAENKPGLENLFDDQDLFRPTQWIAPVVVLLLLVGTMVFLQKKGYLGMGRHRAEGKLRIKDQILLGNRQFLVVVEYGGNEILVGIGPGFISHVSTLSANGEAGKTGGEEKGKFDEALQQELESKAEEN